MQPYLRALCLKDEPPVPYPLPARALRTSRSIHVSTRDLPGPVWREPLGLEATFFLRYEPGASGPSVRQVTSAEGGAPMPRRSTRCSPGGRIDGAIRTPDVPLGSFGRLALPRHWSAYEHHRPRHYEASGVRAMLDLVLGSDGAAAALRRQARSQGAQGSSPAASGPRGPVESDQRSTELLDHSRPCWSTWPEAIAPW